MMSLIGGVMQLGGAGLGAMGQHRADAATAEQLRRGRSTAVMLDDQVADSAIATARKLGGRWSTAAADRSLKRWGRAGALPASASPGNGDALAAAMADYQAMAAPQAVQQASATAQRDAMGRLIVPTLLARKRLRNLSADMPGKLSRAGQQGAGLRLAGGLLSSLGGGDAFSGGI